MRPTLEKITSIAIMQPFRIGYGYDVHRLSEGRRLWIGGIIIESDKGEVAHSDGDVLLHALCDAMLGALALGDIGTHFPDTSDEFKDIDSKRLLARCAGMVRERGYRVSNMDAMLRLERPKIAPYIPAIRETIASILGCSADDVSIKATTCEGMGFVGRGEGIDASVAVMLRAVE